LAVHGEVLEDRSNATVHNEREGGRIRTDEPGDRPARFALGFLGKRAIKSLGASREALPGRRRAVNRAARRSLRGS